MSQRIYLHEFERPDVDLDAGAIVVFERADGSSVRIHFDSDGEIYVSNDDGRVAVEPRSSNVLILKPTSRAVVAAARRVRRVIGQDGGVDYASVDDVRTLIEAALR